ncbi:MAG: presqualene diphosphate synthase HpnD [Chlorobi bacterium]|nr:presqualene diphosphate synthase HpnD [Chlorobiota bacterium]
MEALVTSSMTSFYYSFSLLPREIRQAITTLYAFCRTVDQIVDATPLAYGADVASRHAQLEWWRRQIDAIYGSGAIAPLVRPLALVVERFAIPKQYLLTLLDGVERDLVQQRYVTFEELKSYCYSVAGVVGLMSIHVFGYRYDESEEYAVNLGYALQLTNIIRDVKEDKDRGYIYLPLDELERFRYAEADLQAEVYDDRFIELMRFQARRTRTYYNRARAALHPDERATLYPAEIMDAIYYRLLEKIELGNFDVFRRRYRVRTPHKLWLATKIWLYAKLLSRRR